MDSQKLEHRVNSLSHDPGSGRSPPVELARAAALAAMQQVIDDLPEQIALLDDQCVIQAVNRSWSETMKKLRYAGVSPGDDYRQVVSKYAATGYEAAIKAQAALDEIARGERDSWQMIYNGRDDWSDQEFQMSIHRVVVGAQVFITITRWELTEIWKLRRLKDEFSTTLIEGQALERQRLARELHDSTSQLLATVSLLLGRLKHKATRKVQMTVIAEIQQLMTEAQQEIRSISYLAHPPVLDRMSFADAVKALAEGFDERSGIPVTVLIRDELRFPSVEIESAFYRIVQEALSNVRRHAHASKATVAVRASRRMIHVIITDDGTGIRHGSQPGVGLAGMRSRLAELGGRLSIRSLSPGTAIIASVREPSPAC